MRAAQSVEGYLLRSEQTLLQHHSCRATLIGIFFIKIHKKMYYSAETRQDLYRRHGRHWNRQFQLIPFQPS